VSCPSTGKRLDGMFILKDIDSSTPQIDGVLKEEFLTISAAVIITGYNSQYLRRLLRNGRLAGVRVGQIWLIKLHSLAGYLTSFNAANDRRFGAKHSPHTSMIE
jgi:hypothetical protein